MTLRCLCACLKMLKVWPQIDSDRAQVPLQRDNSIYAAIIKLELKAWSCFASLVTAGSYRQQWQSPCVACGCAIVCKTTVAVHELSSFANIWNTRFGTMAS